MPLLCPKSVDIFLFSLLVHEILHAVEHFRHKIKHAVDRCRRRDGHGHHARQTVLDDEERDGVDLDARTRAAAMIADAEKQVKLAVGGIQEQTAFEEKRLETAKAATAKFIDAARAICNTQLKNIEAVANGVLPQAAEAKPAVSVDDTVRSIENSASRIQADPSIQIDIPPVKTAPAAPARQRKLDSTQPFSL